MVGGMGGIVMVGLRTIAVGGGVVSVLLIGRRQTVESLNMEMQQARCPME